MLDSSFSKIFLFHFKAQLSKTQEKDISFWTRITSAAFLFDLKPVLPYNRRRDD